jgi:hypothetical protein
MTNVGKIFSYREFGMPLLINLNTWLSAARPTRSAVARGALSPRARVEPANGESRPDWASRHPIGGGALRHGPESDHQ